MVEFNVPANISVEDFFKVHVPKQFQDALSKVDLAFLAGKAFTLQFDIDAKKYCVKVSGNKNLEIIPGGIDHPMLTLALSEAFWRDAVTGKVAGAMDQFTNPAQMADAKRYDLIQNTKGTLKVEMKLESGQVVPLTIRFNAAAAPETTIKLAMSDWIAMQKKETDGQNLVMAGKMQFDGDVMFLMQLQNLL